MESHSMVVAQQLPKPRSAVKTDREFAGFFQMNIQSPLFVFVYHPFGRILIRIRPDGASTKTISQYIQLVCGLIILVSDFNNLLNDGFLSEERLYP